MAICRPEAIDAAPVHGPEQSGGWRRGDFLASRGMGEAQGKKVEPPPLRLRRSRRSRPLARSAKERPWVARRTASSGEVVANLKGPAQEDRPAGRREGGPGVEKGRHRLSPTGRKAVRLTGSLSAGSEEGSKRSSRAAVSCRIGSGRAFTAPIFANLFEDWQRREHQCLWSCSRSSAGE
jgi:hypothetical protein